MLKTLKIAALGLGLTALAACGNNDFERGVTGGIIGGVAADATGNDVATGVAVGATAGVFCDNAGVCR